MRELPLLARHAGTVFVGQIAVMAFGITDTMVAARYSAEALAALSVGSATYISIFVALLGVLSAQLPIWSELRGAGRPIELGRSVRQSLYLAALVSAAGMVVLLWPGPILDWTDVPAALRGEVERYLAILALALPPALLFRLYSTLNQSLGRPLLVTWIQIGSLGLKIPLSLWFVFGGAGLPALGLAGCALATLVVNWAMLGIAVLMLRTQDLYAPYRLWQRLEPPYGPTLRGFARLGIPTGLAVMVEVTSFTLMALFIARQGTAAAASHQVASTVAASLYMVPLALGIAISARVSYWLGALQLARARAVLRLGLKLTLGLGLACALGSGCCTCPWPACSQATTRLWWPWPPRCSPGSPSTTWWTRCRRSACLCCAATASPPPRSWPMACCCGEWDWAAATCSPTAGCPT